ncbi:DUF1310 family protein [Streptococcus intermedius]|uniref:DUF1310 family protein n=1 Tax=Streptococcus intermedius TaxID=1338 RepID=UPI002001C0F9|nr:DUF1310 family protein [Streptococcus intermedius]MDK8091799.1 DUF1310 family protein [Streptococcus intermedius]
MKKVLLILGVVLLGIVLVIGGCKVQRKSQKEQMLEIVKSDEAKKAIEECLKDYEPKAFMPDGVIQSYKIDYDSVKRNPMGGIMFVMYINNNQKYDINAILDKKNEKLEISSYGVSMELDTLVKGEK